MAEEYFTKELLEKMAEAKVRELEAKDAKGAGVELKMSVSPICHSDDGKKKYAFVTFEDGKRCAEGRIPECSILKNDGFEDDEIAGLIAYMKGNLSELKKMASQNNVLKAMMK